MLQFTSSSLASSHTVDSWIFNETSHVEVPDDLSAPHYQLDADNHPAAASGAEDVGHTDSIVAEDSDTTQHTSALDTDKVGSTGRIVAKASVNTQKAAASGADSDDEDHKSGNVTPPPRQVPMQHQSDGLYADQVPMGMGGPPHGHP